MFLLNYINPMEWLFLTNRHNIYSLTICEALLFFPKMITHIYPNDIGVERNFSLQIFGALVGND
jgi:hypothetical protein